MTTLRGMSDAIEEERSAYISKALNLAITELAERHNAGRPVCDVAFLIGEMQEATKEFNRTLATVN